MRNRHWRSMAMALLVMVSACGGGAAVIPTTDPSTPPAPPTTDAPTTTTTTTSTTTTTTTTPTTTTTLPGVEEASIDGTWDVTIEYSNLESVELPPDQRTYAFTSDCGGDNCEVTAEVEIGILGQMGQTETRTVQLERAESGYEFLFVEDETFEDGGRTLCVFTHNRRVTFAVDEAEMIDGTWTANHMSGEFRDPIEVAEEGEGVDCNAFEVVGTVTLERSN